MDDIAKLLHNYDTMVRPGPSPSSLDVGSLSKSAQTEQVEDPNMYLLGVKALDGAFQLGFFLAVQQIIPHPF